MSSDHHSLSVFMDDYKMFHDASRLINYLMWGSEARYKCLIFVTQVCFFFLDHWSIHYILVLMEETITRALCPTADCYLLINLCSLSYLT